MRTHGLLCSERPVPSTLAYVPRAGPWIEMAAWEPDFGGSEFAPMRPGVNPGVVLAAMQRDALAPRLVSEALCGDREVVLAAVRRTGAALQFIAGDL